MVDWTKKRFAVMIAWFFLIGSSLNVFSGVELPVQQGKMSEREVYRILMTESKVKVDGNLDETAWKNALLIPLDYEVFPGENIESPVYTECLLVYDRAHLYVAFRANDPDPSRIRAHFSDRDRLGGDDQVGLLIDTFNDQTRAFGFFINPLGIQRDLIISNGGTDWDNSWDAIWESAGNLTEFGYVVEIGIPFSSLQFQDKSDEQTWGIDLFRIYPRMQSHRLKHYKDDRNEECMICKFPKLTGIKGAKPGKRFELDPTLTAVRSDDRPDFISGPLKKANSSVDIGISGHWGFTPNLTLSGAVNPDFSQVEADVAQLDINTQFALYYPEKRPFFLEGLDFFKTPMNAVYTRSIADPNWGLKLSGKQGKSAIGFFTARDGMTNLLFPGSQSSASGFYDQKVLSSVLRYRRDIGSASTLGLLVTDREGDDYYNRVAGIDGVFRINKSDTVTFQFLGSRTLYPLEISQNFNQDQNGFNGTALNLSYQRTKRNYLFHIFYDDCSAGFRADLGFMPQVDFRRLDMIGGYWLWGEKGDFYTKLEFNGKAYYMADRQGNLMERKAGFEFVLHGPLMSFLALELMTKRKVFNGISFEQFLGQLYFQFRPSGSIDFTLMTSYGDEIDYAHTRSGKTFYIEPQLNYNLGRHLTLSLNHSLNRLQVEDGRLFTAQLSQLRLIYHFNQKVFIRAIIQYTDINRNTGLYEFEVDPEYQKLFSQFLFSYKINPRTVLFLGYSDQYNGYMTIPLTQVKRTFFLKIGYALPF